MVFADADRGDAALKARHPHRHEAGHLRRLLGAAADAAAPAPDAAVFQRAGAVEARADRVRPGGAGLGAWPAEPQERRDCDHRHQTHEEDKSLHVLDSLPRASNYGGEYDC